MFWPDDPKPPPRPDDLNPDPKDTPDLNPWGRVPDPKDTPDLNPEDNIPKDPPDCC